MKQLISILGSTGSIGTTTLKIVDKKKHQLKPYIFTANKNFNLICGQIKKYKPKIFVVTDYRTFEKVKIKFKKKNIKILNNFNDLKSLKKNNITISAIPGIAGLKPTIKMIKMSKKILLANKESIICGWNIIKKNSKIYNTKLIPIDSEHYSIAKLLEKHNINEIKKIYITASGGPFLNYTINQLKKVKPIDALKHPKWNMGKKISIDSSTLMNKLLELIEAQKFFNIPNNILEIIIHPNSLVHAIISLKNGISLFLYHETSMIIPIANAIFDGKININELYKIKNKKKYLDISSLVFEKVNPKTFPLIKLKEQVNKYPSSPIIVNASNEILVDQFIHKKIPFLGIFKIIMMIFKDNNYKKYAIKKPKNINQITKIDTWAKLKTMENIKKIYD